MYRWAQCVSTSHCTVWALFHHANTRGSGPNGSRLQALVRLKTVCHPRVMSRSLPHLTLTTSTSSLSTSPIIPSSSPTLPDLLTHDPHLHCEDSRRSGGTTKFPSPTGYELSSAGSWSWTSRSITRKNYGRWLSVSNHWRYELITDNWCKIAVLYPITYTLRLWFSRKRCRLGPRRWTITDNAGFTAKETWRNGNTDERSKCTTNSSWSLKTRELDVKFVSRAESFGETWCNVFI